MAYGLKACSCHPLRLTVKKKEKRTKKLFLKNISTNSPSVKLTGKIICEHPHFLNCLVFLLHNKERLEYKPYHLMFIKVEYRPYHLMFVKG